MAIIQTVTVFVATIFIATILCGGVSAQAPASEPSEYGPSMSAAPPPEYGPSAAAPTLDCSTNLLNMSDCLTYVEAGSKTTKPDKACCPELAGLVDSAPQCLCTLLGGNFAEQYGIKIDMNKALKLPSVCRVTTPPPSLCSVLGIPVAAPMANDGSMSPGVQPPEAASPSTANKDSGASYIAGSALASLLGLAIALLTTFF